MAQHAVHQTRIALTLLYACALSFCAQVPQIPEGETDQAFMTGLLTLLYLDSGNCARSYKVGTNSGQLYCSRAPRSICNYWEGFYYLAPSPIYGKIFVSKATQDRYRADWGFITSDYSTCAASSAAATSLGTTPPQPGFRLQTNVQQNNALTIFTHNVVDNCDSLGNSNLTKLATKAQYQFLVSPRGVLAYQARFLGQTTCLDSIPLSAWEKQTAIDYNAGNIILETTCNYGSAAAPNNCNSSEKAAANAFDFPGAL